MNKQDIIKRLNNPRLSAHERETLQQLLHYLTVEGLTSSKSYSSNRNNNKRKRVNKPNK